VEKQETPKKSGIAILPHRQDSEDRHRHTISPLLAATIATGGMMIVGDGVFSKLRKPSDKDCANPNCQEPAAPGRTHCSAECYKKHYKLK